MVRGQTAFGQNVEDVASCQKSITAFLVGIACEKGFVKLSDAVHDHLGTGWSQASREQEAAITLKHLITMTSGLNAKLKYEAPAGAGGSTTRQPIRAA